MRAALLPRSIELPADICYREQIDVYTIADMMREITPSRYFQRFTCYYLPRKSRSDFMKSLHSTMPSRHFAGRLLYGMV